MKKQIIAMALLLSMGCGTVAAQDSEDNAEKKKAKREFTLPKAGDIALGIDIAPMFRYIGNMFNHSTENSYNSFGGAYVLENADPINHPTVSIMGKYMITDHVAARLNVGVMTVSSTDRVYSIDDAKIAFNPLSEAEVIDQRKLTNSGASFALGAEYRRGYKFIQGFAGADVIYGFNNQNIHYFYGNAITEINQTPTRHDWTDPSPVSIPTPSYWTRGYVLDEYNGGATHYVGLGVHVGVECFLTSYLAIGGEMSLNAIWSIGTPHYAITEGFNTLTGTVEQRTETLSPGNTEFVFGTQNLGGKLYMAFYF